MSVFGPPFELPRFKSMVNERRNRLGDVATDAQQRANEHVTREAQAIFDSCLENNRFPDGIDAIHDKEAFFRFKKLRRMYLQQHPNSPYRACLYAQQRPSLRVDETQPAPRARPSLPPGRYCSFFNERTKKFCASPYCKITELGERCQRHDEAYQRVQAAKREARRASWDAHIKEAERRKTHPEEFQEMDLDEGDEEDDDDDGSAFRIVPTVYDTSGSYAVK